VAGVACYWGATGLKRLLKADDSLDVFGVHGIGGLVGCIMTGLLASKAVSGVSGNVLVQATGAIVVALYSAVGTALLLGLTQLITGLRVDEQSELDGLDLSQHRERIGS
jgi:ammonium transporter, Amt family